MNGRRKRERSTSVRRSSALWPSCTLSGRSQAARASRKQIMISASIYAMFCCGAITLGCSSAPSGRDQQAARMRPAGVYEVDLVLRSKDAGRQMTSMVHIAMLACDALEKVSKDPTGREADAYLADAKQILRNQLEDLHSLKNMLSEKMHFVSSTDADREMMCLVNQAILACYVLENVSRDPTGGGTGTQLADAKQVLRDVLDGLGAGEVKRGNEPSVE